MLRRHKGSRGVTPYILNLGNIRMYLASYPRNYFPKIKEVLVSIRLVPLRTPVTAMGQGDLAVHRVF
jgi:hypothetical protein